MAIAELKEVIWTDEASFNRFSKLEDEAKQTFEKLKAIHKIVLEHDIQNYKEFLANSLDYLVNEYFEANKKYYPPTADKYKAFHVVDVEISDIKYLCDRFNNIVKELKQHKPIVKASSISWSVKKSDFEYYLAEDKIEHYKALKEFLKASQKLEQFEQLQKGFLIKSSQNLRPNGIDVEIVTPNFI